MIDVKRAVKDNKRVTFEYYRDGALWYRTQHNEIFPVPISDIGNAMFRASDKAILFMRYMNLWNKNCVPDKQHDPSGPMGYGVLSNYDQYGKTNA